jgi:hypothetical protein
MDHDCGLDRHRTGTSPSRIEHPASVDWLRQLIDCTIGKQNGPMRSAAENELKPLIMTLALVCLLGLAACGGFPRAPAEGSEGAPWDVVEVIFDGTACSVGTSTSLPEGSFSFVRTNESDLRGVDLYVSRLSDGHKFQELIDLQHEVGGPPSFFPIPDWVIEEMAGWGRVELDLAENQRQYAFNLHPGEHAIFIRIRGGIWLCGRLDVVGLELSRVRPATASADPEDLRSSNPVPMVAATTDKAVGTDQAH